jgi:serine/threonine-protein kinase HipA
MRKAKVFMHGQLAGILVEVEPGSNYRFEYQEGYRGEPISLCLPIQQGAYEFDGFPPFFDGLLPEGLLLEALLRRQKIDRSDYFTQLLTVGQDLVGAVTVGEA